MEVITPLNAHAFAPVSEAEYLALDAAGETKYELIDGRVFAMAGGLPAHNLISGNIYTALRARLRGSPCLPFNSDQRIHIPETGSYVYPDVSVVCRPFTRRADDASSFVKPRMLCEVLSPSTREHDLGLKWSHYQMMPGLEEMLFVHLEPRLVEHFHRVGEDQWLMTRVIGQGVVKLDAFGITLPLDEVYADLDILSATE